MPRIARGLLAGHAYHVLNRGNGQATIFHEDGHYQAFLDLLVAAKVRFPVQLVGFCIMPNHFHLVVQPASGSALSPFMQWWLTSHVRRYHQHYGGGGHVWQGRFKSFPIQQDEHLLTVLRYIERNPLRAGLGARAEDWLWSSLRERGTAGTLLDPGPVPRPAEWVAWANAAMTEADVHRIRHSVNRGTPFGSAAWAVRIAQHLGLEASLRPRGRPRKQLEK